MFLRELTTVPMAALPLEVFRDHLRLGTGFADLGAADAVLAGCLRGAMAAIEGRTAKALIARDYRLRLAQWRLPERQPLPLSPVSAVLAVRVADATGAEILIPAARYRLVRDLQRPRIEAAGRGLPDIPEGGAVEIDLTAGFGPDWTALPADLQQAVLLLAAQYYEMRHDAQAEGGAMPFGVMALIERWRTVRMLGGRG